MASHEAAETIEPLSVTALRSKFASGSVENSGGAIQRCALVAGLDLYQPATAARMGIAYVDFKAMSMVG